MEVTTVSPSPASPTEGDDLCEIDVTSVAIHSVTLLICLCGLAGNGAVLWLFCSHSLYRNCPTRCILVLTFIDFLFLFFLVPSSLLFLLDDTCSFIMPLQYVSLVFRLLLLPYTLWLYTLTFISIQRCRSIHCPLWHCCHRPQHLPWVVCAGLWAFSISVITFIAILLCPPQLPEQCRVPVMSKYIFDLLLCAPFMLISSTILLVKVISCSHQQQPKSLDIVICFIVLFSLPLSLWNLLQEIGYSIFSSPVAFLLTCIHSSIKPLIYFLAGRCWRRCSVESLRLSLQSIFEEPEENPACSDDAAMEAML